MVKDDDNEKVKQAIKKVSSKNYKTLQNWIEDNPDHIKDDTKSYFLAKTVSSIGKPLAPVSEKIIKNVCKKTHVKET